MTTNRAWALLPSGRRLDLLNPDSQAWTDHDLSLGLSRTYCWPGIRPGTCHCLLRSTA
jgi:hypothetical protein